VPRTSFFAASAAAGGLLLAACGSSSSYKQPSASASAPTAAPAAYVTPNSSSTPTAAPAASPFLSGLTNISTLGSTVPANGDVNPYGIVTVPTSTGKLHAGDVLISNFNAKTNNQGTGTTIVQMTPGGKRTVFAAIPQHGLPGKCPGGVGLTTALSVLPGGYVVVGSLPTTDGKSHTAKAGCLLVVAPSGHVLSTIAGPLVQGPWDMTSVTHGSTTSLFVSMVLVGGAKVAAHKVVRNSTVVRFTISSGAGQSPKVLGSQTVANKIPWRDDPSALAIGPTGVAVSSGGTLYINDTLSNRISAVPQALTRTTAAADGGSTVSQGQGLKQPLGMTLAPNGDILTTNGGDGKMVETTPAGKQVATKTADTKTGAGTLFGLTIASGGKGIYYVDDGDNTLKLLH
jgi:hypothetical protein